MARLRSGWCKLVLGDGLQVSRPIVWIIGFFAFLNVYSMQAVLPLVMQEFHATPVQAGATVGATVLAIALVSPFMGIALGCAGPQADGVQLPVCANHSHGADSAG